MDFISYANFRLAKSNPTTMLNNTALFEHSEKTFQTFCKHFATKGKWTYGGPAKGSVYDSDSGLGSAEEVNGTPTERIEVFAMNETTTWLSISIILILIIILIVLIISIQIVYPKDSMQHRVECLAGMSRIPRINVSIAMLQSRRAFIECPSYRQRCGGCLDRVIITSLISSPVISYWNTEMSDELSRI
jgi:hypothetical protein